MTHLLRFALVLLPLASCMTDEVPADIDEPISEEEAGKADAIQASRHYLLYRDDTGPKMVRAFGGALRCPDDVVREICEIDEFAIEPTPGLRTPREVLIDELEQHPVIVRGRLVRVSSNDSVHLRASAAHRGITTMVPQPTCYRMRKADGAKMEFTRLDGSKVTTADVTYFDDVDPTPGYWGEPTPAVQALIDEAVEQSKTRIVYACGGFDDRGPGHNYFWAEQVFANL